MWVGMGEDIDVKGSMASRTPTSLRQLSALSLASAVVHQCQPQNWNGSYSIILPHWASATTIAEFLDIESIILAKQQIINRDYFLWTNDRLAIVLKAVLSWWNGVNGLDSLPWPLQREVRQAITKVLEISKISVLFKLVLEVLFALEAGGSLPGHMLRSDTHVLRLSVASWNAFSTLIDKIGPVRLSGLNTGLMDCSDPEPVLAIIRNAPHLTALKLYTPNRMSEDLLQPIAQHCPNLELLMLNVGNLYTHIDCLYALFFSGAKEKEVLKFLIQGKHVSLSFPNLKCVHMMLNCYIISWNSAVKQFLQVLIHYYPGLHSVLPLSVDDLNLNFFAPIPDKNVFEGIDRQTCRLKRIKLPEHYGKAENVDQIVEMCPEVSHLTVDGCIYGDYDTVEEIIIAEKLKTLVKKFSVGCLTIHPRHLDVYIPLFEAIGSHLKDLTVVQWFDPILEQLCTLINKCQRLESLKFKFMNPAQTFECRCQNLRTLPSLSSLSVVALRTSDYVFSSEAAACVQYLLGSAPNLSQIELNMQAVEAVRTLAQRGRLKSLETLILLGEVYFYRAVPDRFRTQLQQTIEALPQLHTLVLYLIREDFLYYFNLYRNTELRVMDGFSLLSRETTQYYLTHGIY